MGSSASPLTPLVRASPSAAVSMPRSKARPFGSTQSNSSYGSHSGNTLSFGLSIGRSDRHYSGSAYSRTYRPSLHRYSSHYYNPVGLFGGLYYGGSHHGGLYFGGSNYHGRYYDYGRSCYSSPYYGFGYGYLSAYYPTYGYYWPGYHRTSYYSLLGGYDRYPVTYSYYDTDSYYADGVADVVYAQPDALEGQDDLRPAGQSPEVLAESYPTAAEPPGAPSSGLDAALQEGHAAFAAGRYEDARRWYVRALLEDTHDGRTKLLYGVANFATGDYEVAATALGSALMETPELIDEPVDLRSLYRDDHALRLHLDELEGSLSAGIRTGSSFATGPGALLLGYLRLAAGEPELALAALDRMIATDSAGALGSLLRDVAYRASRR